MTNKIQFELDGKAIGITVSDDQMSIVSDDGREFKAIATTGDIDKDCDNCAFNAVSLYGCEPIPCAYFERNDGSVYFIELTPTHSAPQQSST